MRTRPIVVALLSALLLTACATPSPGTPPSEGGSSTPPTSTETSSPGTAPPAPPTAEPPGDGVEYHVSYGFAVPSTPVSITHQITPPIAAPPAPPLPYLVGVYVGNHPEGTPAYQRISFYFRGTFPSYTFQYAPAVLSAGQGTPIPLPGNANLSIVFISAQAHDEAGKSTVVESAPTSVGFTNLKGYGSAGDYEGYVSYGLGIQVAPNSGQVLPIRSGELKRPDGSGGYFYVVHFDVATG